MFYSRSCQALALAVLVAPACAQEALEELRSMYPGVRSFEPGQHIRYVWGASMTPGTTELEASSMFLAQHGSVLLDSGALELAQDWSIPSHDGRFQILSYKQRIRGKEVDGGAMRIRVRREPMPRVDYAAAKLAGEPTAGSESPLVPASVASALVQLQRGFGTLAIQGEPELVVLRGSDSRPDAWCWRIRATDAESPYGVAHTFFVDTATPRVVFIRHGFANFDPPTTGTVKASGTPAVYPYYPYGLASSLVTHRMPGVRIRGSVGGNFGTAYTNGLGEFSWTLGQTGQFIALESTLEEPGAWYRVRRDASAQLPEEWLAAAQQSTAGSSVPLTMSNADLSEEFRVAQADSVVTINRARQFFLQYMSASVSGLSRPVWIFPNHLGQFTCNGATGFNPAPAAWIIILSRANGTIDGCYNWGGHSMSAHEYGHVALAMLGIDIGSQAAFHEGFADTYANMLNDDTVQGRSLQLVNSQPTNVRGDPTSNPINCQFPIRAHQTLNCSCDFPHLAGQLLSGPWVRIRTSLKAHYGNSNGLERARLLFGAWSLITLGEGHEECEAAHPGTLLEVLIASIATEDLVTTAIVRQAFAAHSIPSVAGF